MLILLNIYLISCFCEGFFAYLFWKRMVSYLESKNKKTDDYLSKIDGLNSGWKCFIPISNTIMSFCLLLAIFASYHTKNINIMELVLERILEEEKK